MADPWLVAFEEAVGSRDKAEKAFETIELQHPSIQEEGFPVGVRMVNDVVNQDFTLEATASLNAGEVVTFTGIPFTFGFPDIEQGRAPESDVRISNARREVAKYLDAGELMAAPLVVIYRVYMLSAPTQVAMGPFRFLMREISEEGAAVSGRVTFANPQNLKFPRQTYNAQNFPALLQSS
jgi:Domain of unknown function (DUF1833)